MSSAASSSTSIPANPKALTDATAGAAEHLTFSLAIRKTNGTSLGIDVTYSSAAAWTRNGVFIARVFENGLVANWNAESREPFVVQTGDFIFQVNEVFGDTVAMIQEMKMKSDLSIFVLRRSGAAASSLVPPASIAPAAAEQPAKGAVPKAKPEEEPPKAEAAACVEAADVGDAGTARKPDPAPDPDPDPDLDPPRPQCSVEEMLPHLVALSDEALADLICGALERRPWLRAGVFAPFDDADMMGRRGDDDEEGISLVPITAMQ